MNIEDRSSGGIWTNATAKYQDWAESTPFLYNETTNKRNRRQSEVEIAVNDTLWSWNHDETAAANKTVMTYTRTSKLGTLSWPIWHFWVVAVLLFIGSIIFTEIWGHIIRLIARISISRRKTFRAVTSVLWLA
jgi:hypothetical protein